MKTMFKELFRFKWIIFALFITVVGGVIANLALPMYLSNVINIAIPNQNKQQILSIGGTMLMFVVLGVVANISTGFFASVSSVGLGKNVRSKVFSKIQYFSQVEFDKFSTSSLITRTNNDIIQVQTFVNMLLRVCLMAPIMCVGGIIMAFAKSSTMSLILVISMPIMIIFVLIIAKIATPISTIMQKKLDEINLVTREKLTGIRVARAFGTEEFEEKHFENVNQSFANNAIKMNIVLGILMPGLSLILYGTMVALIG
ncbi:MAG: ABC transporter permease, partial [Anaerotignaceae bacterium]